MTTLLIRLIGIIGMASYVHGLFSRMGISLNTGQKKRIKDYEEEYNKGMPDSAGDLCTTFLDRCHLFRKRHLLLFYTTGGDCWGRSHLLGMGLLPC